MADKKIAKAIKARNSSERRVASFQNFLRDFEINEDNCLELQIRLENVNESWDQFQTVQSKIKALSSGEEEEEHFAFRTQSEDKYYNITSIVRGFVAYS